MDQRWIFVDLRYILKISGKNHGKKMNVGTICTILFNLTRKFWVLNSKGSSTDGI